MSRRISQATMAMTLTTALLGLGVATARGQQLDLDPAGARGLPSSQLRLVMTQLDQQVIMLAQRRSQVRGDLAEAVIDAQAGYRQLARRLLVTAGGEARYNDIAIAGYRMVAAVDRFDERMQQLLQRPDLAEQRPRLLDALRRAGPTPAHELMMQLPEPFDDAPDLAQRRVLLAPFVALAALSESSPRAFHERFTNAWLMEADAVVTRPSPPNANDLESMLGQLGHPDLPQPLRQHGQAIVSALQRALAAPEFLPFIDDAYRRLDQALALARAAQAAETLTEPVKQALLQAIGEAVAAYAVPARRENAQVRLSRLAQTVPLLEVVEATHPPAALREAVEGLIRVFAGPTPEPHERQAAAWLVRVTRAINARQAIESPPTQPRVRLAYLAVDRDFNQTLNTVMGIVPRVSLDPGQTQLPGAIEAERQLQQQVRTLQVLTELPGRLETLPAMNPRPSLGIQQRMIAAVDRAIGSRNPADRLSALADVIALDAQMSRYTSLPGEAALRSPDHPARRVLDQAGDRLFAIVAQQRQAWVDAWARGEPADRAAAHMEPLALLFEVLTCVRPIGDDRGWTLAPAWSTWAGWTPDSSTTQALFEPVNLVVAQAMDHVAQGDAAALASGLEQLQRDHSLQLSLLRLARRLPEAPPPSIENTFAAMLLNPDEQALLADRRGDLMSLSRLIIELAHPAAQRNRALWRQAERLADRLAR